MTTGCKQLRDSGEDTVQVGGLPVAAPQSYSANHGVTEPGSGVYPMGVQLQHQMVLTLTALKGRQRFHKGQDSIRHIKNTKRGSKLFLDLTTIGGM